MSDKIPDHILERTGNNYAGTTYYDRSKNRFIQIRKSITHSHLGKESVICSDWVEFYESSKTVIINQYLTTEYVAENLIAVDFSRDDLFFHDGIGWRVRDCDL